MKKLITTFAAILLSVCVFAQAPQKMSYQAVIRNSNAQLVINHAVGMQVSILQGSASGTVVYSEIQTPNTNANGLVSIEIGGEAGFNNIDWSDGPYFIKTETDPSGGTTYSIIGTSQLLSTPYALYAKTAETVSGGYSPNIMTKAEIAALINPAEGLLVYNSDTKVLNLFNGSIWVDMSGNVAFLKIGQTYAGGIIFQLDATGLHGLVIQASYLDSAPWGCSGTVISGADGTAIGTGNQNTTDIVTACADVTAAFYCYNITFNGYSDWYLPSKDEILLAVSTLQPMGIGGFGWDNIWSSSEVDSDKAWIYKKEGNMLSEYKSSHYYSRGVRNF